MSVPKAVDPTDPGNGENPGGNPGTGPGSGSGSGYFCMVATQGEGSTLKKGAFGGSNCDVLTQDSN